MAIWKEAMKIVKEVYILTADLPTEEKFGLKSQMQRCAVSIPSNIAEGSGRNTDKELLYFLNIAISSSYELETQIILVEDLYNLKSENIINDLHSIQRMIGGFKRSINSNTLTKSHES